MDREGFCRFCRQRQLLRGKRADSPVGGNAALLGQDPAQAVVKDPCKKLSGRQLGLPAGFGAAMGLVSVFCGAVNCPLASIILSVELFGSGDLLYFAMACSISYLISGYCGLYSSQTILYSKLRAEFINVRTHE